MKIINKNLLSAGVLFVTVCTVSANAQQPVKAPIKKAGPAIFSTPVSAASSSKPTKLALPQKPAIVEPAGDPLWYTKFQDIEFIANPLDWSFKPTTVLPEGLSVHFNPPASAGGYIDFWVREIRATPDKVSDAEKAARQQIFKSADHDLTEAEKQSIPELLKAYNSRSQNPAQIRKCKVIPFHGKRSLFITATVPQDLENGYVGGMIIDTLVDTSGDGTRIVQFDYEAEIDVFEAHAKTVGKSIDSVKFK